MPTSVTISYTTPNDEEFVGPFPTWRNVKTHYGAVGDGVADDTSAIQSALADLEVARNNGWSVLYFPAGTYKITSTLTTNRTNSNGYTGCQILGEDPATTKLSWGSATAANMFDLDGWYLKVGRLSFDGNNVAVAGLRRYDNFSTSCALVDLWFENLAIGIYFDGSANGQAEQLVKRCHFANCSTGGVVTRGFNTLDIWVWNSLFTDCVFGIKCITGGFHAYDNVFLRSTTCDIAGSTGGSFCIVGNTSIDSRCFVDGISGGGFGGAAHIKGNKIHDPTLASDAKAVIYLQGQPLILLDNTIASLSGASGAVVGWASGGPRFAVNNTYTVSSWAMQPAPDPFHAANAFDSNGVTYVDGSNWGRSDVKNAWLQYSFCYGNGPHAERKVVDGYAITAASGLAFSTLRNPKDWAFEASNDGATWTVLDTRTGETFTTGQRETYHFINQTPYCMYRLKVTDNSNSLDVGGVRIAELELLDGTTDLTKGAGGLATAWAHGYASDWGQTYVRDDTHVAKSSLPTPTIVHLPGVPPKTTRTIYEVPPGASTLTIQAAIHDAVAAGNRAVVHIPAYSSGGAPVSYSINETLTVPAKADIQILGDGGKMNATTLAWTGTGNGPVLRIEGPTHCIVRDIVLNGHPNATAVQLTNADQKDGEVFLEGCDIHGGNDTYRGEAAFYLSGNDDTNVTAIATNAYGFMRYGVKAIGGPKLTAGMASTSRFANIGGAGRTSDSLISFVDVQDGARVAHEGVYLEAGGTPDSAVQSVKLQGTRGRVAFTSTRFSTYTSDATPTFLVSDHDGELTMLGCLHVKLGSGSGQWFQLTGSGNATKVMVLGSFQPYVGNLWNDQNEIWKDTTSPAADAAYWMSPVGNVWNKKLGAVPSEQFIRDSIAFARSIRAPLPQPGLSSKVTAVRFYECTLHPGKDEYGLRIDGPPASTHPHP